MKRGMPLLEVALFYSLVLAVIWNPFKWSPPGALLALLLIGICVLSNRYHGDDREKIGFADKHFWPCVRLVTPVAIVLLIPIVWLAWGKNAPEGWNFWFSTLGYPVWAFAQEYALLGFVGNRLADGLPDHPTLVPWINGFLFSMAHLPNPILMTATFVAGVLFTHFFFKERHLIPISLVHALFGVAISVAFGHINGVMSVGPGYWARVGNPITF